MTENTPNKIYYGKREQFSDSSERPDGIKVITLKDSFGFIVDMIPDVLYTRRDGEDLRIQLFLPFVDMPENNRTYPLVVFLQGSAWHRQRIFLHMQHMIRVSEYGYVVALVQYRPSDIAPFPAQIEDTKTAIRFLKKNADKYHINPDKIALWGDSSGGHTAVMAGITKDGEMDIDQYSEYSAKINCIIDWYGPTDIAKMNDFPSTMDHSLPSSPEGMLIGRKNVQDNPELVAPTIPMNYLSCDRTIPPILIMHGDKDELVAFNQSCLLYNKLRELNKDVEMFELNGGYHGFGGFNCDEAIKIAINFLKQNGCGS